MMETSLIFSIRSPDIPATLVTLNTTKECYMVYYKNEAQDSIEKITQENLSVNLTTTLRQPPHLILLCPLTLLKREIYHLGAQPTTLATPEPLTPPGITKTTYL